jgi:hypothetical protein
MRAEPAPRRLRPGRLGRVDSRRTLGPIGTVSRVAVGAFALVAGVVGPDVQTWDIVAAAAVFPLMAVVADRALAGAWTRMPAALVTSPGPARYLAGVVAVGIAVGLTFVTPADAPAVWLWLGGSLLVGAARGDAGCEVLAVANLLTGRRRNDGCIVFAPIDAAESRRHAHRREPRSDARHRPRVWMP